MGDEAWARAERVPDGTAAETAVGGEGFLELQKFATRIPDRHSVNDMIRRASSAGSGWGTPDRRGQRTDEVPGPKEAPEMLSREVCDKVFKYSLDRLGVPELKAHSMHGRLWTAAGWCGRDTVLKAWRRRGGMWWWVVMGKEEVERHGTPAAHVGHRRAQPIVGLRFYSMDP